MAKWMVSGKRADFNEIARLCGISPVTARLIRNRDVVGAEETSVYIGGTMADLTPPERLPGMADAVRILADAIARKKKIRIIGDYDVDGICSSFILQRMITFLGGTADTELPNRVTDGYGINERLVEQAAADGADLILTCDNGIAAKEVLQKAKDAGLTVIVTDHHEIPYEEENGKRRFILPPADAIVEPKLPDPATGEPLYGFPEICGAAVAFKLSQIMLGKPDITGSRAKDREETQKVLRELLAFCGIATVCDVMPLVKENRILVRYGLLEAAASENTGLRALLLASGLDGVRLTCYHAGFVIGPCLNAPGRLDTARRALDLFFEKDPEKAMMTASELRSLNESRKSMTEKGAEDAMQMAATRFAADRVLIVRLDDLHESLAGIVAGRLREKYERPVIVLTPSSEDEGILKGSGRSIEAYDMFEQLNRFREMFLKFGGHKMAAGLTILREKEEELRKALNESCTLTEEDMTEVLHIDMELPPRFITMEMTDEFRLLEPCGNQNQRPLFVTRDLLLTLDRVLGKNRNVLKIRGTDQTGRSFDMILFDPPEKHPYLQPGHPVRCNVVYYPEINEWRGNRSLQFVIRDLKTV